MKSLKTIRKAPLMGFFLVAFSCTIIQDNDITSADQLSKLKWQGVEIKQETSKGNSSTAATLLYDSAVNLIDTSTGAKITRRMRFSLAPLGNLKMKLRSETTAKTELYVSYKEGNQPYTVGIYSGDSVVEIYRFRYNSTSSTAKLNKIITILNPVDGLPETLRTNDTLIFDNSGKLASITRRSPDATKTGTITLEYLSSPSPGLSKITWDPTSSTVNSTYQQFQQNQNSCPNGTYTNECGAFSISVTCPPSGSCPSPQVNFLFNNTNALLSQGVLMDYRRLDTYYLHPVMLLKNQLTLGGDLFIIYMIDWWSAAPVTNTSQNNNNNNDVVTFNFLYVP